MRFVCGPASPIIPIATTAALLMACAACKQGAMPEPGSAGEERDTTVPPPSEAQVAVKRASMPSRSSAKKRSHSVGWAKAFVADGPQAARALAAGGDDSLFFAGYFRSMSPLGTTKTQDPEADGFVGKLDKSGDVSWLVELTGPGPDTVDAVATDNHDNVIVAGSMTDQLTFGRESLTSAGADDMFAAKYDGGGRRLWAKRYGGANIDAFHGVATDKSGAIYLVGVFRDQFSLQGKSIASKGGADVLLVKLDANGNLEWLRTLGAAGEDYGRAVSVDSQGDVVVVAEFSEVIDVANTQLTSQGNRDIALIKLNQRGEMRWAKSFGGIMDELVFAVATDPADNITVTGSFDAKIVFGPTELVSRGEADVFVSQFSPDGETRWAHGFGGKQEDIGYAVATDPFGTVFVTGWFRGKADFGPSSLQALGKSDIFLASIDSEGHIDTAEQFGNTETDLGKGVAVLSDGGVALAGTIVMNVAFGNVTVGAPRNQGDQIPRGDAFVSRFVQ